MTKGWKAVGPCKEQRQDGSLVMWRTDERGVSSEYGLSRTSLTTSYNDKSTSKLKWP